MSGARLEFERQVAEALGTDRGFGDAMVCHACGAPDLGDLASRVAAAILAYHDHRWGQAMIDATAALAHREAAALVALRQARKILGGPA